MEELPDGQDGEELMCGKLLWRKLMRVGRAGTASHLKGLFGQRQSGFGHHRTSHGRLGENAIYNQGQSSTEFLKRLFQFCKHPINRARLNSICPLCEQYKGIIQFEGETLGTVSSEVWVKGKPNVIYISPIVIFHLVQAHSYFPPAEFVEAVLECDPNWHNDMKQGT